MKTFALSIVLTLVQLFSSQSWAYILPLENILQKSAVLAGTSILSVEQDVQFKEGAKIFTIKESWLIEGDRNLKLTARGVGELKDIVSLNYVYNSKNRTKLNLKNKVTQSASADFFEKYLAIKSKDSYLSYIKELNIVENVRLSRAGGLICFAIGVESTVDELKPQMWIDQNSFRLIKLRLPSGAEIEFNDYIEKDGAHYPRQKIISWNGKTVTITVTKISAAQSTTIKSFYPDSLEFSSSLNASSAGVARASIEEFYQRFR
jgi:hypothetical protein